MDHRVDSAERRRERVPVGHVRLDELRRLGDEHRTGAAVNLLDECVVDDDLVPGVEQQLDHMRTDEARATRHQHSFRHQGAPFSVALPPLMGGS